MWFTEQKSTRIQRWRARASSKQAPEIKNSDFELTFSIIPFRLAETNSKWALDGQYQNGEHNIHQQFSFFATPTMGMGWDGVWWRMRGERQLWRWSALHSISLFPLNSRTKRSISFRLLPRIMHTGIGNVHNGPLLPISHILSREMSKCRVRKLDGLTIGCWLFGRKRKRAFVHTASLTPPFLRSLSPPPLSDSVHCIDSAAGTAATAALHTANVIARQLSLSLSHSVSAYFPPSTNTFLIKLWKPFIFNCCSPTSLSQ